MFQGISTKAGIGAKFERMSEDYFVQKGYRLIQRNFRIKGGEIDLILEEGRPGSSVLVFVEVRMRDPRSFETPEESLRGKKRVRLIKAAKFFLTRYDGQAQEVRFDLISIRGDSVVHHQDFFRE